MSQYVNRIKNVESIRGLTRASFMDSSESLDLKHTNELLTFSMAHVWKARNQKYNLIASILTRGY